MLVATEPAATAYARLAATAYARLAAIAYPTNITGMLMQQSAASAELDAIESAATFEVAATADAKLPTCTSCDNKHS